MIKISKELLELAQIFEKRSKLYVVGGYIRDSLLNIKNYDIDITSALLLDEVEELLQNTNFSIKITNKQFGTAKIIGKNQTYEYCSFREDFYSSGGKHSPKKIAFVTLLEQDAKRRDFTINALYFDIINNKIIDVFDGLNDIKNRLIKAVPPAENILSNDGERLLRMAKFKAKLGFEIDKNTLNCAIKFCNNLNDLSPTTIQKFLDSIKNFSIKQKQDIKETLKKLSDNKISQQI